MAYPSYKLFLTVIYAKKLDDFPVLCNNKVYYLTVGISEFKLIMTLMNEVDVVVLCDLMKVATMTRLLKQFGKQTVVKRARISFHHDTLSIIRAMV